MLLSATEEESAEAAEREALEEEAGKKHSDRSQKKLPKNTTKSVTTWKTLSCNDRYAFLQLNPTTGRKHQLRLICSHVLNAPIIGDFKYGYEGEQVSGHLLHCFQLKFPVGQAQIYGVTKMD